MQKADYDEVLFLSTLGKRHTTSVLQSQVSNKRGLLWQSLAQPSQNVNQDMNFDLFIAGDTNVNFGDAIIIVVILLLLTASKRAVLLL